MSAVVAGANRGIGLELARQLRCRGDNVIATSRPAAPAELSGIEGIKVVENVDICKVDTLGSLSAACDSGISTLIVNAGLLVAASDGKKLADLTEDDLKAFTTEWEVNAMGPLRTVVALQSKLKDGAKIVLLGTTLSSNANNKDGGIHGYRASKAALHNIGVTLANELKDKASVAVVHPGFVETGMTDPLGFKAGTGGVVNTADSAANIVKVMDKMCADNSGGAWDAGTGESFAW